MYIESIRLRDWKSYTQETLVFPRPTTNKNVVLIGAENGYGKTSLLEALMLCLYGKDALVHIPRATILENDENKLGLSYGEFIKRAFHGLALESGRTSSTVVVTLNDDGIRYEIARIWHFQGNGKLREEELRVSIDGVPFKAGRLDDKPDALRNLIARLFVPVYLAPFFLFDGEQVQRLAQKDMAAQVKTGIEGLLGVATLRDLQRDLRAFVVNRRQGLRTGDTAALDSAEDALTSLESNLARIDSELKELEPKLRMLREQAENKNRLLKAIAGGNSANVKELNEAHSRAETQRAILREKLSEFLKADLALCLIGKSLHSKLLARIEAEEALDLWTATKEQNRNQFERLSSAMLAEQPTPPLLETQVEWLKDQLEKAWESIWYPPPNKCADSIRHPTLGPRERTQITARILTLQSIGLGDIEDLVSSFTRAEQEVLQAEERVRNLASIEDQANKAVEDVRSATEAEENARSRQRELAREAEALKAQISQKRAEVERSRESLDRSQPLQARVKRATDLADAIDLMIADMYPLKVREVAEAMTAIYKDLAHKSLLHKVSISDDCEVELLDRHGQDLRRYDNSAGESQIFAIALISAIASVSGSEIPMVIDTPLARLDEKHRLAVLKHLAALPSQVVLLSATDEVAGQYYDAVSRRVGAEYLLEFEELDGTIGQSRAKKGYWGRNA